MNGIVWTVLLVGGIGLLAGLLLSVAAIVLAVQKDETAEKLQALLPGANCGACGFSGCAGYAAALAGGKTDQTGLCAPGGAQTAAQLAEALGISAQAFVKKAAVVRCQGNRDKTAFKQDYRGLQSCAAANQLFGGPQACRFGCIGLGDCLAVCEYGAISIENGLADIDRNVCTGCGKCVRQCPKGLITLTAEPRKLTVKCVNHDKGAKIRSVCTTGCIGCMKCVKACEHGAIKVEQFLATIDDSLCTACGKCAEVCPNGCIL